MRKVICVAALLLVLTCPAYAGDMPNGTPQPPLAPVVQEPTEDTPKDETIDDETPNDETDILTQITLELLSILPSIF